jgi:hypothetical protein
MSRPFTVLTFQPRRNDHDEKEAARILRQLQPRRRNPAMFWLHTILKAQHLAIGTLWWLSRMAI